MRAVKNNLPASSGKVGESEALARANGTSRRASGWAGENVARSWDHPGDPLLGDSSLRPCLGNGASWRAGAGRVRTVDVLSILFGLLLMFQKYRPSKVR